MHNDLKQYQVRMGYLFLINLIITLLIPLVFAPFGHLIDYLLAFVVGYIGLSLVERRYFFFLFWATIFFLYLVYEIILSNLALAWLVIQPKPKLDPGIVAIPLTITTGIEITTLASAITLTPGTLSLDLGSDANGRPVLYVHALRVGDPAKFRLSIQQGFERMILRISRGVDRV
jgi:multicomponent Na+:H+ antiporter subunit E